MQPSGVRDVRWVPPEPPRVAEIDLVPAPRRSVDRCGTLAVTQGREDRRDEILHAADRDGPECDAE
jgi:hypothetical protein